MDNLGGISPAHAAAGFGGGLAALPFMKPGRVLVAVGMVVAGVATSAFLTPLLVDVLSSPNWGYKISSRAENGLAFLLGLSAMILIPAFLAAMGWVKDNVSRIMERVTGVAPKPPGES